MFYKKGINTCNSKEMFEFLKNHSTYNIKHYNKVRHYENNLKEESVANRVISFNINLFLEEEQYSIIDKMLVDWQNNHPKYKVIINANNDTYLVLCNEKNKFNVLPAFIYSCDYDEFKSYCSKEFGGIKYYNKILHEYVKLVRDFDKLSDKIYDYLNEVINKM